MIEITPLEFAFLFLAAVAAGGLNAVAGGGSFFTFPTLLLVGVPSVPSNATNTIALWPGVVAGIGAYRQHLSKLRSRLLPYATISMIGGGAGAWLLLSIPETTFERMIPFLMLTATSIFASSGPINRWMRSGEHGTLESRLWLLLLLQFVIAVYGGFFGGGIGIMMLALLSVSGIEDMNEMNSLKLVLNAMINGVAIILFVLGGKIYWPAAAVMIIGAIAGGYAGAMVAQRVEQKWVRVFVIVVGSVLTIYFFTKYW